MNESSQKQTNYAYRFSNYLKSHKVSLGLLLAAYGACYLSSVILSDWTVTAWGNEVTGYPPSFINPLLPRSFINPIFFVCLLYTSPSPRDGLLSRMPSSA